MEQSSDYNDLPVSFLDAEVLEDEDDDEENE